MEATGDTFRVLVVEDEALLTMDIEMVVEECGYRVVAEATCLREVETLPDSTRPDLALVDIHLGQGPSGIEVCALIQRRWAEAAIVFVTANPTRVPADFAGAQGIIAKPFSHRGLALALHYLRQGVRTPPPTLALPGSLTAAPAFLASWRQ